MVMHLSAEHVALERRDVIGSHHQLAARAARIPNSVSRHRRAALVRFPHPKTNRMVWCPQLAHPGLSHAARSTCRFLPFLHPAQHQGPAL